MFTGRNLGRWIACAAAAISLAWTTAPGHAAEVVPPPPSNHNGPAFLVISSTMTFATNVSGPPVLPSGDFNPPAFGGGEGGQFVPPTGSPLVIIPIGQFIAGFDVRSTSFQSSGSMDSPQLAALIAQLSSDAGLPIPDSHVLNGHQYTIFGAVDTIGTNSIHMLSTDGGFVPQEVQQAVWSASPALAALYAPGSEQQVPQTTADLVNFICLHQAPAEVQANPQEIANFLFINLQGPLQCTACEADGQLFPHDPELGNPLFSHEIKFGADGHVSVEARTIVKIDVKPGLDNATNPINLKSKGDTPLAILSNRSFNPHDVDPATVTLFAKKPHPESNFPWTGAHALLGKPGPGVSFTDLNGDGIPDMVLHFNTPDLANPLLGGLSAGTTTVVLAGQTFGHVGIQGTDTVKVLAK